MSSSLLRILDLPCVKKKLIMVLGSESSSQESTFHKLLGYATEDDMLIKHGAVEILLAV